MPEAITYKVTKGKTACLLSVQNSAQLILQMVLETSNLSQQRDGLKDSICDILKEDSFKYSPG
ncbi:hypothetical protein [Synechococcus sp. CC9616]|uniref:hypothetical protein n=1 Tax=Synechococcus sp. CC9616 TaxID=110663 RepID=UPI0004B5EE72|nr:hypothetical protein [Synechococcus sp. CC9616]